MADRPFNRRGFFIEGIKELLRSAQKMAEPLAEAARQFAELENPTPKPKPSYTPPSYAPPPETPQRHWIRPPGSVADQQFVETCSRCGECVRMCPVQCIKMDYSGESGNGVPYIDPDADACVLCEGLMCQSYCPSAVILPTPREQINMGLAVWHENSCLRLTGQECTICIDKCPIGSNAIRLTEGKIEVGSPGCVGCGMCQRECPTMPKSITVLPRSAMMK